MRPPPTFRSAPGTDPRRWRATFRAAFENEKEQAEYQAASGRERWGTGADRGGNATPAWGARGRAGAVCTRRFGRNQAVETFRSTFRKIWQEEGQGRVQDASCGEVPVHGADDPVVPVRHQ